MTPKTKVELRIVELSKSLPTITKKYHRQAYADCFDRLAVQSRKTIFCLECGNNWKCLHNNEIKTTTCKQCRKKLIFTDSYNNGLRETDYYQVLTTAGEFQIVRMVCITKWMKKNQKCGYFAHEVMQIFIDENGRTRTLSKNIMGMSQYFDQWIVGSALTLKQSENSNRLNLKPSFIHPVMQISPKLKRNGFDGNFHGIPPQLLFREILKDNIAETLLKSQQFDMLYYHIRNTSLKTTDIYWKSLRICNRNSYQIKDAKLWVDYVDLLDHFGKDLRNPKYVCPVDLEVAHNKWMLKKQDEIIKSTFEEKKKQIAKNQKRYFKTKKQFFGLVFSNEHISVNVIETVKEFLEEGCIHKHCVFTNEYYKKDNSLILSAKVKGVHIETVQVSLENFEILQSRGRGNKATKYNKDIIDLVKRNMHQIGARMKKAS